MRRRVKASATRVVVATENDVLSGIVAALAHSSRHEQVGHVTSVTDAKRTAARADAQVVVVEVLTMQCFDRLRALAAAVPTVVVSHLPPEEALLPSVAAGARGFVWQPEAAERLDEVVAVVAAGETCLESYRLGWLDGVAPDDLRRRSRLGNVVRLVDSPGLRRRRHPQD